MIINRLHRKKTHKKTDFSPKKDFHSKAAYLIFFAETESFIDMPCFLHGRISLSPQDYHRSCFRCKVCKKNLESGSHAEHGGEVYCKGTYCRVSRRSQLSREPSYCKAAGNAVISREPSYCKAAGNTVISREPSYCKAAGNTVISREPSYCKAAGNTVIL